MIFTSIYFTGEGRCARGTRENSLIKAFRMQCAASVFSVFNEYNLKISTVHFYCGKFRKYEKIGILCSILDTSPGTYVILKLLYGSTCSKAVLNISKYASFKNVQKNLCLQLHICSSYGIYAQFV